MNEEFNSLFYPRGIAIIGASNNFFSGGSPFLVSLLSAKYPREKLFPINPKYQEIFGLKAYPSLLDVPHPVDYVIIAIPKRSIMGAVDDCIKKGVKLICSFTSGFSELGTEEGIEQEKKLIEKIKKHDIRLLGPNCIGIYSSESRISFQGALYHTVGPENVGDISIISQSGGNTDVIIGHGHCIGMKFNKAVSYGNGADINADELLEFFAGDPTTNLILEYLEGFKNPKQAQNYLRILRDTSKKKPVVIWKGGTSESGARAIKSHTGSIAGDYRISNIALQQNGAVTLDNMYDLINTGLLFSKLQKQGKFHKIKPELAIVGGGGGNTVQYADTLSSYGLNFPAFSEEISKEILTVVGEVGTLLKNPIDLNVAMFEIKVVKRMLQILDSHLDCTLIYEPGIEWMLFNEKVLIECATEYDVNFEKMLKSNMKMIVRLERKLKNPLIIMSPSFFRDPDILKSKFILEKLFLDANIPVIDHLKYLGVSLSKLLHYKDWLANNS